MTDINLLSEELRPKKQVARIAKSLKKMAMVAAVLFLTSLLIVLGSFLILSNRVQASKNLQERLKTEIKALEQTEQRLVLVRDRLEKIEKISTIQDVSSEVETLSDVINISQEGVEFKQAHLKTDRADLEIVTNSSNLTRFLTDLIASGNYQRIELLSLDFYPDKGYEVGLSLVR